MKTIALLLCGLALVASSPPKNEKWESFKSQFGKSYPNPTEEKYRQTVHDDNQQFIDEHNARYEQGLEMYDLQMNQFGDMTQDEIIDAMNGYNMLQKRRPVRIFTYNPNEPNEDSVDWRDKGYVTPVKDQKQCGSCWAFSATGSLEGQHFKKTGKLVSLSEQNLVDCSQHFGNMGCFGGLMDNAFRYIKSNNGIDTEESYPYEAQNGPCRFNPDNVGATDTGYVDIAKADENALKTAVNTIGPVSVAIDASKSTFHFYHTGIYSDPTCSSTALDHGVLAVGYGSEANGGDYWIVKNSWNMTWGDQGYIKMSRNNNNNCGIATEASYPLV